MASTLFASLDEALRDGSSITVERSLALVDSFLAATGEVPLINNMTRDETSGDLGKVVRFRCMVQDVRNPEVYQTVMSGSDGALHCGKFREVEAVDDEIHDTCASRGGFDMVNFVDLMSSSSRLLFQRQVFRCVSVPGESDWVGACDGGRSQCSSIEAIVKVYDVEEMEKDVLKLHEVVEVTGILDCVGVNDLVSNGCLPPIAEESEELSSASASKSTCRIQVLTFQRLNEWSPAMPLNESMKKELVTERVRGELIRFLSRSLQGDRLAAEYLLLHMVSRHVTGIDPGSIRDSGVVIGHWPLNISGFPQGNDGGSIRGLAGCIGDLLPRVKEMDVNVEALNSDKLVPRKNYETDELVAGDLQIAPRTYLVFDETRLNPGRFNVDNLRAIQLLVRDQKICVDFGPTRIEFPTEVNCLTLSTSESILSKGGASGPCSVHLPLVPSIDDVDECAQKSSYSLGALRAYLAIVSSLREQVDLSGQLGDDVIPDAWHRARTDDPSISQTDLFIWITLLRPMLLSRGRTEFDEKIWNELLELERQRRARLRKL